MAKRLALYPATLDPVHCGHVDIARRAAQVFDEVVVAVYDSPQKRLLFSASERLALAREAFVADRNISVARYSGLTVQFASSLGAVALVRGLRVFADFELEFRTGLANRKLDAAIETVAFIADERYLCVSSSIVREIAQLGGDVSAMVPPHVAEALRQRYIDSLPGPDRQREK